MLTITLINTFVTKYTPYEFEFGCLIYLQSNKSLSVHERLSEHKGL